MHLSEVLPFTRWHILYHCTPAVRVRQTRLSDRLKNIIASIDGSDGAIQGSFDDFA